MRHHILYKYIFTTVLSVACAVSLSACSGSKNNSGTALETSLSASEEISTQSNIQQAVTTQAVPAIPVTKLSMYIYNKDSGYREKASDVYESTWVKGQDIVSFESFATDVDRFSLSGSNFKNEWEKYWNTFEGSNTCRLGYVVDFKLKDGQEIKQTITGPDDVFGYRNYLECYLYDDVNQIQGNWYSHLLNTEVTDKTVMTSIKLTAGTDIALVGGTIKVSAFVYNSDKDFDVAGNYIGNVIYSVNVVNK